MYAGRLSRLFVLMLGGLASGCLRTHSADRGTADDPTPLDERFVPRLLAIAAEYESYGRLDAKARPAPTFCEAPDNGFDVPQPAFSASKDPSTHGLKLYSLFVREAQPNEFTFGDYVTPGKPQPVGQVLVKESWTAEEISDDKVSFDPIVRQGVRRIHKDDGTEALIAHEDRFVPFVRKEGRLYHARERAELFIMYKTDPETPGTDEGWVYGTVTADRKEVTSAGLVTGCMQCHVRAPHDRLFGLARIREPLGSGRSNAPRDER